METSELSAQEIIERLGRVEDLRVLPAAEVDALAAAASGARFSDGEKIMEEGGAGDALHFVISGEVRVEKGGRGELARLGPGGIIGEAALLRGTPRTATVTACGDVETVRIARERFEALVAGTPEIKTALESLDRLRREGRQDEIASRQEWVSTALRSLEARYRGAPGWMLFMFAGLALWAGLSVNEQAHWLPEAGRGGLFAGLRLLTGLLVIQGACEAFVIGVERLGARVGWDGFISGTVGSIVSTLPEFVVIAFLVRVEPLAAFVTAAVTIFNNALVFAIYSFFLPKDGRGAYEMPRSLTIAGGQILIAGAAVSLIVGIMMLILRFEGLKTSLAGADLIVVGTVLIAIYAVYVATLVRYYAEGKDEESSVPPDPSELGHDTSFGGIAGMLALGAVGAYCGGEAIGAFAETALKRLGLPTIPTAAALAFFAGVSEYIIVYKAHKRGELGIALSNVFGGMSQVMFLLLPFGMLLIGILGLAGDAARFCVPINPATTLLVLLLFPLFYALHQYLELDKTVSNLDAAALTGIYALLLYFLFTAPA